MNPGDHLGSTTGSQPILAVWPRLLTLQQAALYLGLSPKTIKNHKSKLPGRRKWGDKIVFDRCALDKMIDRSEGLRSLWVDAARLSE